MRKTILRITATSYLDDLTIFAENESDLQLAASIMEEYNQTTKIKGNADKSWIVALNSPPPDIVYNNTLVKILRKHETGRILGCFLTGAGAIAHSFSVAQKK
jgi:hypothetical protein